MGKAKVLATKRASKTPSSNNISKENEIKKLIEKAENGLSSKNAVINAKNLKTYKKILESIESGTVNNTTEGPNTSGYPGMGKTSVGPGLMENILHKFASYTTLFTLSGVGEGELQDHSFLTNPVHDVIARSSGIGDPNLSGTGANDLTEAGPQIDQKARENESYKNSVGVLKKGRDIFFEDVNMMSTVGPSEERGLADFVKMEFKLHEPYGISFIEKVRAAARINGYRDYQDAPMLLTIEF
jgi:hypothetical protein